MGRLLGDLRLTLPYPDANLLPNASRRLHWADRAVASASLRHDSAMLARSQKPDGWNAAKRVDIEITWYAPKKGRQLLPDRDGLLTASKAILDALQPTRTWPNKRSGVMVIDPGASIISSDSERCIRHLILRPVERDLNFPRTVIVIQRLDKEQGVSGT